MDQRVLLDWRWQLSHEERSSLFSREKIVCCVRGPQVAQRACSSQLRSWQSDPMICAGRTPACENPEGCYKRQVHMQLHRRRVDFWSLTFPKPNMSFFPPDLLFLPLPTLQAALPAHHQLLLGQQLWSHPTCARHISNECTANLKASAFRITSRFQPPPLTKIPCLDCCRAHPQTSPFHPVIQVRAQTALQRGLPTQCSLVLWVLCSLSVFCSHS